MVEREMEVWSWGAGTQGQLATGSMVDALVPQQVPALGGEHGRSKDMACGGAHAGALLGSGEVLTWGCGNSGQLGHGDRKTLSEPRLVRALQGIKIRSLAAGWGHTAFVSECGGIFTCGDGAFGQLGLGDFGSRAHPSRVESLKNTTVCMAACGMRHTLVLVQAKGAASSVFAFGACKRGQLGVFPFTADGRQDLGSWQVHARRIGRVCEPLRLSCLDDQRIECVAAGGDHSAAVDDAGSLFVWGRGYSNGFDTPLPSRTEGSPCFRQVALGWSHGLGLSRDGKVLSWGNNQRGQLGCKDEKAVNAGVRLQVVEGLDPGKTTWISAGAEHSGAVSGEQILLWGWGEHGQLGLATIDDEKLPRQLLFPWSGQKQQKEQEQGVSRLFCGSGFTFLAREPGFLG